MIAPSHGAFAARGVARQILKRPHTTILTRCVATGSGLARRAFDFGGWTRSVEPFLHWNAFRRVGVRLVGIRVARFARGGPKRIGVRSGGAFNASNGSWFRGVESRFASGLIGGFTFTKMTGITCFKCAILKTVRTGRHRIARRGTLDFVAKPTGAFAARGVARQILKESDDTGFAFRRYRGALFR